MTGKAIGGGKDGEIVGRVGQRHSKEIGKGAFSLIRTAHAHIVGRHQRVVGGKEIITLQTGMINDFRCLQVILPIVGPACHQMALVSFHHRQSCLRIQLHTVEASEERAIVHPPLPVGGIHHYGRVDGIHHRRIVRLDDTSPLCPRAFGRISFSQPNIGSLTTKSRHAEIKAVFITIRNNVRRPNIGCPFSTGMRAHPLHRFLWYLRECPSQELPMHQIL